MSKMIYNEGRTVGISSYEEYVRQLKSVDPSFEVCTEREWLAASLATGATAVLKIPANAGEQIADSGMYLYQVQLPNGSHLGAANTLFGYYFAGEGDVDPLGWVTTITSYGTLISNTEASSPADDSTNITASNPPTGDMASALKIPGKMDANPKFTAEQRRLLQYTKIADGIVIQPGHWHGTGKAKPYKDIDPELSASDIPVLRLTFSDAVAEEFYIIITGFENRSIIRGITKFDFGSTDTENRRDFDFMGPECYPWACKVQFASSPYAEYLLYQSIRSGSRNLKVEASGEYPMVKITSNNLLNTTVASREADASTGTSKYKGQPTLDDINETVSPHKTWTGRTSASEWYSTAGKANDVSVCEDPQGIGVSGRESITLHKDIKHADGKTPLGLTVDDKYHDDDVNMVKNGMHGGFYDIDIDPYRLIKDFIDEMFARFGYVDDRFDSTEEYLSQLYRNLFKKTDTLDKHVHDDMGFDRNLKGDGGNTNVKKYVDDNINAIDVRVDPAKDENLLDITRKDKNEKNYEPGVEFLLNPANPIVDGNGFKITLKNGNIEHKLLLKAGLGIQLSTDSRGYVEITNTEVGGKWTKLSTEDFDFTWHCGWYGTANSLGWDSDAPINKQQFYDGRKVAPDVRIIQSTEVDEDGNEKIVSAQIRITDGSIMRFCNNADLLNTTEFAFKHDNKFNDNTAAPGDTPTYNYLNSAILSISFKGDYEALNNMKISAVSAPSINIWNVRGTKAKTLEPGTKVKWINCGASWAVNTSVTTEFDEMTNTHINDGKYPGVEQDGTVDFRKFLLYAVNIADGYNLQYTQPHYDVEHLCIKNFANITQDFILV